MKRITFIFIILLLAISHGYADGNPAEAAEHWEKVRQLDQLAERFKAETGFRGEVMHSTTTMRLHVYRGNFPGVSFTADGDTIAFRQACEGIISKVLPNSQANSNQLSMSRISKSGRGYTTDYYQQVNGYRVEGAGYIMITFEDGRKYFSISDNTVDLPDGDVSANITPEEAEQIALSVVNDEHYNNTECLKLFFSNMGSDRHYLAYQVNVTSNESPLYRDIVYWIDAITGKVKHYIVDPYLRSNIKVTVSGNYYNETLDANNISTVNVTCPVEDVMVCIADSTAQTNSLGIAEINGVIYSNQKAKLYNSHFNMAAHPHSSTLETSSFIPGNTDEYIVALPDSNHYSPNAYIEAVNHIKNLSVLKPNYFNNNLKIVTKYPFTNLFQWGSFSPVSSIIELRDARIHSTVRHELSHHFVERIVGTVVTSLSDTTKQAMDEGLANYFCGSPTNNDRITSFGGHKTLSTCYIAHNYGNPINEEIYSYYIQGIPLASAWWGLRGNQYFPADGQKNGVDTLLVHSLNQVKDELPVNNTYRYKPRYFYNILMSRVDNNSTSWPLNDKQVAIDSVYSVRGFHFYTKVQSVASASVQNPLARESFNVLDSVYVHISNYPQNTYGHVFVVEDRDYLNVGSGGIAIPAPFEVNGNPVSRIFKTDGDGKWAGGIPFSKLLPQGNYDIIVNNMVNPTTPDNILHLAFKNDNIIDGVDGLTGPGFSKTGTGDIVVALDLSSSMQDYGDQLAQMVKALEHSMIDSERINVFGFTEGTANQNWLENGITDLIGDESTFIEATQIDTTAIDNIINSIDRRITR